MLPSSVEFAEIKGQIGDWGTASWEIVCRFRWHAVFV